LNGRYPCLFNFPLLEQLKIHYSDSLKFDLEMLAGLPLLKELSCFDNDSVTGNLKSLRVLKDTIEKVEIIYCQNVEGNFMELADFPCLKQLDLFHTAVTGDIRDIDKQDFLPLETLSLPKGVYGGKGYELQRISDAPGIVSTLYPIYKQRPTLLEDWHAELSEDSPDWYSNAFGAPYVSTAPLCIRLVEAASRVGYRWITDRSTHPCEVIWLDPEPYIESIDFEKYIEEVQEIELQVGVYQGFQQPPTEDEHNRLWAGAVYED